MKNLIFFTFSYPFSNDYMWKRYEINELKKYFKITIVPFIYNKPRLNNLPFDIDVVKPLTKNLEFKDVFKLLNIDIIFRLKYYLKELFECKVLLKKKWLLQWIVDLIRTEILIKNKFIVALMKDLKEKDDFILYFYWGVGCSLIIPFIKKISTPNIIVRFHGFDLYEERKTGYIPFRSSILSNLDHAIFISKHGLDYSRKKYSNFKFNRHLFKIGSKRANPPKKARNKEFRIVSCSNVVPLKRVELIPMALKKLEIEIEWTHIGDGKSFEKLKEKCMELPKNIRYKLCGRVSPEDVLNLYSTKKFNLFINVSSTEGLSVSIMEALSAGIPVMATNVGGTSEIVNQYNGILLNSEISHSELAKEINNFYFLDDEEKQKLSIEAKNTYLQSCDIETLNKNFISFLLSL